MRSGVGPRKGHCHRPHKVSRLDLEHANMHPPGPPLPCPRGHTGASATRSGAESSACWTGPPPPRRREVHLPHRPIIVALHASARPEPAPPTFTVDPRGVHLDWFYRWCHHSRQPQLLTSWKTTCAGGPPLLFTTLLAPPPCMTRLLSARRGESSHSTIWCAMRHLNRRLTLQFSRASSPALRTATSTPPAAGCGVAPS